MDTIYIQPSLTMRQIQVIQGGMLGDGSATKSPRYWNYLHGQSVQDHIGTDKINYLKFILNELSGFARCLKTVTCKRKPKIIEGKLVSTVVDPFFVYRLESRACTQIDALVKQWYTEEDGKWRKIIPSNLRLTPLSAALWYMDDGSNYAKDAQVTISTDCFSEQEVQRLCDLLQDNLSIKADKVRYKKGGKRFRIRIGRQSYFDFIDMVKAEMKWDCFQYKVDTSGYTKKAHRGSDHSLSVLTEEQIPEIIRLRREGVPRKEVAAKFGITPSLVSQIVNGQRWKHLGLAEHKKCFQRMTPEIRDKALALLAEGKKQKEVADELNVSQSAVSRLHTGRCWTSQQGGSCRD